MSGIRAVVFDLDGTLVRYVGVEFESSWGAIALAAGVRDQSERLLREYLPRREAYAEWVRKDAKLLAGVSVADVADHIFPPPYAAGVRGAVERLRGRYLLGILSSGVDLVADRVCAELGLDFALANHLTVDGGRFTGQSETRVDLWKKDAVLRELAAERGLAVSEICYVGDHSNDIPAMRIAGLSIAFNPKDAELARIAHHVTCDFSEIPDLVDAARPLIGRRARGHVPKMRSPASPRPGRM